ncbi:MAG: carboxypeptidase regulatory-like domain-containing protein [Anaerolineae bacterium]|nr:MAG: carboxypeptidase regulatory-like domain-containing protein [Anaerolineae bacterium]
MSKHLSLPLLVLALLLAALTTAAIAPPQFQQPTATPPALQVTFTADRTQINPGECVTLQWQVSGGFAVFLEDEQVEAQGSKHVCPEESRPYFLRVDLGNRVEERMIQIEVGGEPVEGPPPATEVETPPTEEPLPPAAESETPPAGPNTYRYDFEQGSDGWQLDANWQRVAREDGSGYALRGTGEGKATLTAVQGKITYVKYRFSKDGGLSADITAGPTRYVLEIAARGVCYFEYPPPNGGGEEQCIYGHYPILPRTSHTVEIYINDDSLDIFIDGEGVVGEDLSQPLADQRTLSFESVSEAEQSVTVDDVEVRLDQPVQPPSKARSPYSWQPGPDVGPFTNGAIVGDLTVDGNQSITLGDGRYMVYGNLTLKDNVTLTVGPHTALYISDLFLYDNAQLIVKGGYLLPAGPVFDPATAPPGAKVPGMLGAVYADNQTTVDIENAKVELHFIDAMGQSQLTVKNTRFFTAGGGMVTPYDRATIAVEDSTLGAITLPIPAGATFKAHSLKPGRFESLNLSEDMDISGIGYNLILRNTEIVPDTLPTGHASDASERGWELEVYESAQVELTDCELRKLTLQIPGDGPALTFQNLVVGQPMNATVGPVVMKNSTVRGQWGFYIHGNRQVTIEDSDGVWPLPYDTSQVTVKNSRVNEFDPRQFTGTITFENVRWYGPGEIIMDCNFTMLGSLDLKVPTLAWINSTVTREYLFRVQDASGNPVSGVTITLQRGSETLTATTDAQGEARLRLKFNDDNYQQKWSLTTSNGISSEVGFFTTTPVVLKP